MEKAQFLFVEINCCLVRQLKMKIVRFIAFLFLLLLFVTLVVQSASKMVNSQGICHDEGLADQT